MGSHTEFNMDVLNSTQGNSNHPVILTDKVSVYYRLQHNSPTSAKEFVIRLIRGDLNSSTVKALDGVSLHVDQGEMIGVIGRNGAGKSTLLKVISAIVKPTTGRVRVWGRVTSLLGVGAGFNSELTGRENVFLYSSLLGHSQQEATRLMPSIIEFAELSKFIDAPLRTYSSGMITRLGFAVAMARQPEILLIDEVLGVGDELFKSKCRERFHAYRSRGTTVILVSHSLREIETICQRALWLHEGKLMRIGETKEVAGHYRRFLEGSP